MLDFYKLKKKDMEKALPLFKGLHFTLAVNAIIEGNRPGEIYLDDLENPKTAFALATKGPACYLVGFSDNDEFNSSVQSVIIERITPKVKRLGYEFSVIRFSPDEWEKKIGVILKNQRFWKGYWLWFNTVRRLKANLKELVPVGFSVQQVDQKLLKRVNLKNLNTVVNIILKWNSIDDFMRKGYGFCLIHESTIVSWCVMNKRAGKICEIAIGTDEKHRNAGFATLVGTALLEYCFSKNLEPCWHCPSDNLSSIAVAEKIGFKKKLVYPTYNWFPRWYTYLHWIMKKKPRTLIPTIIRILRSLL